MIPMIPRLHSCFTPIWPPRLRTDGVEPLELCLGTLARVLATVQTIQPARFST